MKPLYDALYSLFADTPQGDPLPYSGKCKEVFESTVHTRSDTPGVKAELARILMADQILPLETEQLWPCEQLPTKKPKTSKDISILEAKRINFDLLWETVIKATEAPRFNGNAGQWLEAFERNIDANVDSIKAALAYLSNTSFPRDLHRTFQGARSLKDSNRWDVEQRSDLIPIGHGDPEAFIRCNPPRGHRLYLPQNMAPNIREAAYPGVALAQILDGWMHRVLLATWTLYWDNKNAKGEFTIDTSYVLRDLFGYKDPKDGRKPFYEALNTLHKIFIIQAGPVGARSPEPLVQRYDNIHDVIKRRGRPDRLAQAIFRHAPILTCSMQGERPNFVQVPKAVMKLSDTRQPMAVALAGLWKDNVTKCINIPGAPGYYRTTLEELSTDLGLPKERWSRFIENLKSTMTDGELGKVHIEGSGSGAVVTMTPSLALESAYKPMAAMYLEKKKKKPAKTFPRKKKAPKGRT